MPTELSRLQHESGENYILRNFIISTLHQRLLRGIFSEKMGLGVYECVSWMGKIRNAYKILVENPEGKMGEQYENGS
jgi:hypothetical protein